MPSGQKNGSNKAFLAKDVTVSYCTRSSCQDISIVIFQVLTTLQISHLFHNFLGSFQWNFELFQFLRMDELS